MQLANPFEMAQSQLDKTAKLLNLDPHVCETLRWPEQEHKFSIPVRIDDGANQLFFGYRVQHNTALGPTKGGLRFHPQETPSTINALAMRNTWRCAIAGIPRGGAMGGAMVDPYTLSQPDLERLMRGFARKTYKYVGEGVDVFSPEVGTTPKMMGWFLDEYSMLVGKYSPGVVSRKFIGPGLGGSLGWREAPGLGVIATIREAMKHRSIDSEKSTAAVQGFGNVGQYAALGFTEQLKGKVLCVSYWEMKDHCAYTVYKPEGINVRFLMTITGNFGGIDKELAIREGYQIEPGDAWITKDVDVLIPAALERQITENTVQKISDRVKIVAEGAYGATTPEADGVLEKQDVFIIPDILCNAGEIIVSYFEEIQSNTQHWWSEELVLKEMDRMIAKASNDVYQYAAFQGVNNRDAANMVAITRVIEAMQYRGMI